MMIFALAALIAGPSAEPTHPRLDASEVAATDLKLGEATPFAVLSVDGAFGSPSEVLGIYVYWDAPYGQANRRRGIAVAKHERNTSEVLWASSQSCAGLETTVAQMEDITPPLLNVPGVGDHEEMPKMVHDGVTYTLWSLWPRWQDREYTNGYHMSFSANVGNPLGTWAEDLRSTLTSCWSGEAPAAA